MFGIERLQAIRELVKEKKTVEVVYLSKELGVSEVTIRRDLDKLEKEGLVAKTYGGAILIEEFVQGGSERDEASMVTKAVEIPGGLSSVAMTASKLIEDNDTIFIGGSAMGHALVRNLLEKEELIVVTNNIEIATFLYNQTDFKVVIIGGEIDRSTGNVVDFEQLEELLIEKAFISVEGIDEQFGYTVNEKNDVKLYKSLKRVSRSLIVVCESEAFGRRGLVKMSGLMTIQSVVTDKGIPDVFKSHYFEQGIKLHTSMIKINA